MKAEKYFRKYYPVIASTLNNDNSAIFNNVVQAMEAYAKHRIKKQQKHNK